MGIRYNVVRVYFWEDKVKNDKKNFELRNFRPRNTVHSESKRP